MIRPEQQSVWGVHVTVLQVECKDQMCVVVTWERLITNRLCDKGGLVWIVVPFLCKKKKKKSISFQCWEVPKNVACKSSWLKHCLFIEGTVHPKFTRRCVCVGLQKKAVAICSLLCPFYIQFFMYLKRYEMQWNVKPDLNLNLVFEKSISLQ